LWWWCRWLDAPADSALADGAVYFGLPADLALPITADLSILPIPCLLATKIAQHITPAPESNSDHFPAFEKTLKQQKKTKMKFLLFTQVGWFQGKEDYPLRSWKGKIERKIIMGAIR
jgi:hypothetical protein